MEPIPFVNLEPRFVRYGWTAHHRDAAREVRRKVETLAEAEGVIFLCPTCYRKNGGPVGTHAVEVTFAGRGVDDSHGSRGRAGGATRWSVIGTGAADLTLSPSIDITPGCDWHGWIQNGAAI